MKIIVFGANGFVGKHLVPFLEDRGHEVFEYTRKKYPKPDFLVDAFINCAGEISLKEFMFDANVLFVEQILKAAKDHNVKKIIHIGSSSEYGKTNMPRQETMPCVPTDIYSATKLAGTNLCLGYAAQYDMDVVVARPFSLYGLHDTPRKLVPRLLRSFAEQEPMKVYPGGHDWTYIDDFLEGLYCLLNAPKELTQGDVVNFGTGKCFSNKEVVQTMEGIFNVSPQIIYEENPYYNYDTEKWLADNTKALMKYGWKPKYSLEDGLRKIINGTASCYRTN